nr:CAP domain-containing protein [Evansella tamaricis]
MLFLMLVFLAYVSKPIWEEPVQQLVPSSIWESIHSTVDLVMENEEIQLTLEHLQKQLYSLFIQPNQSQLELNDRNIEKPPLPLVIPEERLFSIHNIQLGDTRSEVEEKTGASPKRTTINEYGVTWNAYHEDYHNFIMVAYDERDIVLGLYTNQDLIASKTEIQLGSPMELVQEHLGTPESYLRKGFTNYQIDSSEYDMFHLDNSYVTFFYDQHEYHNVTAVKVIDEKLEQGKKKYYTEPSQDLQEGLEYQLFDLTNASRVNHQLPILTWDENVRETSRKHSLDMAENYFFSHNNLDGKTPFERMEEDNIPFNMAGENLAYGQTSSVFAHEGLMNSIGHRENILQKDFRYLGVGVAFNNESHPYYTKKFFNN